MLDSVQARGAAAARHRTRVTHDGTVDSTRTGPTSYLTVAGSAVAEIEVKRSRFQCRVERVETEEAARAVVEEERRRHWDARHHCSAFVLGPDGRLARSSDDGEPAGTAGAPMLEAVRGAGLSDVVVVVTRWFGGTLLGAGGLVRAYGDAVRAGLAEAGTLRRELLDVWTVEVALAEVGRLENDLRGRGLTVRGTAYDAVATVTVALPATLDLVSVVAGLTAGRATARRQGQDWVDVAPHAEPNPTD